MRSDHQTARVIAGAVLLFGAAWPIPVRAQVGSQDVPPPLAQPGQGRPDLTRVDPPARVGRIARATGAVSFHNPDDTDWSAAGVNYPVSSGNSFWVDPSAEAELQIDDGRIVLGGGTEFEVTDLDASGLQAVAAQGEIYVQLRRLDAGETWVVQTPRGLIRISAPGRYGIVAGTTEQPTSVTVVEGSARIEGPGGVLQVQADQTANLAGADEVRSGLGVAVRDAFLTANLATEPGPPAVPVPDDVVALPGGGDLGSAGRWSETTDYGQVWYPPVATGWVPYREGHWAYVAPWGWTWIDNAPWGFAPSHYGRWVEIGDRWAWAPGRRGAIGAPVYAPALVGFVGLGVGVAIGAGLAAHSIGWVPLGPHEPFRPWYHVSGRYMHAVNLGQVSSIHRPEPGDRLVNQRGATVLPATAMTRWRSGQSEARPMTAGEFATATPIVGRQPVQPAGLPPGVGGARAHQMGLAAGGAGALPAMQFPSTPGASLRAPALAAGGPAIGGPAFGAQRFEPGAPRRDLPRIVTRGQAVDRVHDAPPTGLGASSTERGAPPIGRGAIAPGARGATLPEARGALPQVITQTPRMTEPGHPALVAVPHAAPPQVTMPGRGQMPAVFTPVPRQDPPRVVPPNAAMAPVIAPHFAMPVPRQDPPHASSQRFVPAQPAPMQAAPVPPGPAHLAPGRLAAPGGVTR